MQVDELQLRFKINERALLNGLIQSASKVSDEFADELSKKFEEAINKVTKKGQSVMQLGGLFVDFFNEFSEAAGDVDKLSSAMDNLVNRFEFLSNIEKKSGVKGLLNEFSVANMDKLLDYYDKMYEVEEKIQKIREKNSRDQIRQNAQKKVRSVDDLLKMGKGDKDDSKDLRDYVKKYIDDVIKENEKFKPASAEDANKLLAASRQYADLVSAYKKLLQESPKKGSEEAVTQQLEIISILGELKKYEQQNLVLTDFRKKIEKEFSEDFKNIRQEASTIEVQGLTLAINNMVTALIKPLQTQIANIYEDAIEKATGIAVKKGENIMQTYEEAVKVFNLQEEKTSASKKRIGVTKKIPQQFRGTGNVSADAINEEINEFAKYYKSLEDAKQHIAELLNDRDVKATTVDTNNIKKIKDLIGYIQGYLSLGGQIDDLNLDKTTMRRFNLQGMSTNYANQISVIKNTIIDAFKQVAANNYGTAGNAEVVNAAVANEVNTNPNANIIGGTLSDDSVQKILNGLNEIKEEIIKLPHDNINNQNEVQDVLDKVNDIQQIVDLIYKDFYVSIGKIANDIVGLGEKIENIVINIPSDVSNNINTIYKNISDVIIDQLKADKIMSKNNIKMFENAWFFTKNGFSTTPFFHGGESSTNTNVLYDDAKEILRASGEKISYSYHSHAGDKIAAMSFPRYENGKLKYGDLKSFLSDSQLDENIFDIEEQLIGGTKTIQVVFAKKLLSALADKIERTDYVIKDEQGNDAFGDFYTKFAQERDIISKNEKSIANKNIKFNTYESLGGLFNIDLLQSTNATLYEKIKDQTDTFKSEFLAMINDENNISLSFEEILSKYVDKISNERNLSQNDVASLINIFEYNRGKDPDTFLNEHNNQLNDYILKNVFGLDGFLKNYTQTYDLQSKEDVKAFREKYGFAATLNDVVDSLNEIKEEILNLFSSFQNIGNTDGLNNINNELDELKNKTNETKQDIDSLKEKVVELSSSIESLRQSNDMDNFISDEEKFNNLINEIETTKKSAAELIKIWEKLGEEFTDPLDDGAIKTKNRLYSELKKKIEILGYEFNVETQQWNKNNLLTEPDEPFNQDSTPTPIKIKPIIDQQEFVDEITNSIKDEFVKVNVKPNIDDPNLFVSEVTQSINGWNANISVQPEINEPSRFAENVSDQIQFSPAQIPVEPLPEGKFDSERFAQQVTNRLVGETATIDVRFNNENNQDGLNIETESLDALSESLENITRKIGQKTAAFVNEQGVVDKVVNTEKSKLSDLKDVVDGVTSSVNKKTQAFNDEAKSVNAVLKAEQKQQEQADNSSKKKKQLTPEELAKEEDWKETRKMMEAAQKEYTMWQRSQELNKKKEEEKQQEQNLARINKYQNKYNDLSDTYNTEKYPEEYVQKLQLIYEKIQSVKQLDVVEDSDFKQLDDLFDELNKIDKLASSANVSNYIVKINKLIRDNTKMGSDTRERLESYIEDLKDPQLKRGVFKNIVKEVNDLESGMIRAGKAGKSLLQAIKEKAFYRTAQYISTYFSFQDIIRYGKQAAQNVINLNTQFTELAKVSDSTIKQLEKDFSSYANTAKDVGSTITDTISATADWARMGYNLPDSKELARVALIYKNVGDGIDISTANESLISTLQGFQLEAKDAMHIIDVFNETSNNFAISSGGIGEALKRSAASFNAANTDLQKSVALVTTTNTVLQDPQVVGNLWKTMSARIRGAKTELEELNEEEDEFTESTSKLRGLVKGLTGFDIMKDKDTYKDLYDIMIGIGKEWQNLTDIERASLGEALAGKRMANGLYAVLNNIDTLEKAYKTAEESEGSAMREQERYQQSIQYSIDRTKASIEELSQTLISSDLLKFLVNVANGFINITNEVTKFTGLLGTVGIGAGAFAGIKNLGRGKTLPLNSLTI